MENNNRERKILYLGAFLHDIGKAVQRASDEMTREKYYGSHPKQGFEFLLEKKELLSKLFNQDELSCLLKYVQAHHESNYFKDEERADNITDNNLKCLATIVSRADNFSSAERDDNSAEPFNWQTQKIKPVYSIFK